MTEQTTRHTSHGMHTRLVATAADVISRAMQQGRTLPAALAVALDSAQMLQSPETVKQLAEYERLNPQQCPAGQHPDWLIDSEYAHACPWCRIAELEAEREKLIRWHEEDGRALTAAAQRRRELRARNRELERERHSTNESLSDAAEQLRVSRDRIAELENLLDNVADGIRTHASLEDPHASPLHHTYLLGRDLPETGGAR